MAIFKNWHDWTFHRVFVSEAPSFSLVAAQTGQTTLERTREARGDSHPKSSPCGSLRYCRSAHTVAVSSYQGGKQADVDVKSHKLKLDMSGDSELSTQGLQWEQSPRLFTLRRFLPSACRLHLCLISTRCHHICAPLFFFRSLFFHQTVFPLPALLLPSVRWTAPLSGFSALFN